MELKEPAEREGEFDVPILKFTNVTAQWSAEDKPVFRDLSFQFEETDKVAIIGRVGSGKSSLLMAILNEMTITRGQIGLCENSQIVYAE